MSRKILGKIPLLLGFAFLVLAAIFLSWRLIPAQGKQKVLTIPAGILPGRPTGDSLSIQQDLEIKATYPAHIRAGEKDALRLQVLSLVQPDTDIASDGQKLTLTAELTMLNMLQTPQGSISSAYDPRRSSDFSWELTSQEAGMRQGSLWISLYPLQDDGAKVEVPLVAWDIEIEVVRLWGMNSPTVTWLAMLLLLAWGGMMVLGVKLEHDLNLTS